MTTTPISRARSDDAGALATAVDLVAGRCLVRGTSLCVPSQRVWTADRLDDLAARLGRAAARADRSSGPAASFEVRLRRSLTRADDAMILLAAEVLTVHLLFPEDVTAARKRAAVSGVLAWLGDTPAVPAVVDTAFGAGAAPVGAAYHRRRLSHLAWLAAAGATLQRVPGRRRRAALDDPRTTAQVLAGVDAGGGGPQRAALLHLLHPGTFAPVTSQRARAAILRAFGDLVPEDEADPDLALAAVQAALTSRHGERVSFFDPAIAARWR